MPNPSRPTSRRVILNTATRKYHDPSCGVIAQAVLERRPNVVEATLDEVPADYRPCGSCGG